MKKIKTKPLVGHNAIQLSLCMIVKNEERFLAKCLESVKGVVDEMIVVDTGSTDQTVVIAESFGAKVYHHSWQDSFSDARNYGLQFASGNWILQLDADEELEREDIPAILEATHSDKYNGYSVIFMNDGPNQMVMRHRHVRLFRNGCIQFKGIVHNIPVIQGEVGLLPVRIHHHGYNLDSESMMMKYKRSEKLLHKQIEKEPQNTLARAYLVQNLRAQEAYDKAINTGVEALTFTLPLLEKQIIQNDLLYSYFITDKLEKAQEIGLDGLQDNPYHLDMLFVMGSVRVKQKRFNDAISYFFNFLEIRDDGKEKEGLESLQLNTYSYQGRAWNNLGCCFLELCRFTEAIKAYQNAIGYEPVNLTYFKNLAGIFLKVGHNLSALEVLKKTVRQGIADAGIYRLIDLIHDEACYA